MQQERSKTSKFILPERAMLFCFLGSKKPKRNGEITMNCDFCNVHVILQRPAAPVMWMERLLQRDWKRKN